MVRIAKGTIIEELLKIGHPKVTKCGTKKKKISRKGPLKVERNAF